MIALVIQYETDGTIIYAGVQDVQNSTTYLADGYWVAADGRSRPNSPNTSIFDLGYPWLDDLLVTWRDQKYYIAEDDQGVIAVFENAGWQPPNPLSSEP